MAELLFVYGTLRDPDLRSAVLGRRIGATAALAARAPGFATVHYPGRVYPALVRVPGSAADGLVLTDLTPFEIDLLDAYEGEEYRRTLLPVMIDEQLHEVFAYPPAVAVARDAAPWSLAAWQVNHKPRVLAGEASSAEQLRLKLIAIRPH
jgi:gamma-glutamylcyclotransferase (GGCT)/AIG2-like uncharacterized protein YtfP